MLGVNHHMSGFLIIFLMWLQLDYHKGMVRIMGYSKNSTLGTKCDVFIYSHYSYLFVDLAHCACFSVNVYDMKNNNKNLLN